MEKEERRKKSDAPLRSVGIPAQAGAGWAASAQDSLQEPF